MYPSHYIEFLAYFHGSRDYFECHEVLEDYWKQSDPKNRDSVWVFLIQLSVGLYHYRRKNFKGADKLFKRCTSRIQMCRSELIKIGLDADELTAQLEDLNRSVQLEKAYRSVNLPIIDPSLKAQVIKRCQEMEHSFGNRDDSRNERIVHKHKTRKRTDH
ncbi:DUF309 domain-containing protein [Halobacillus fulvus]|nr:DUF309 domain-containing protein [Halobacillus fulvus]